MGGDWNWVDAREGTEQWRRAVQVQIHPQFDPDLLLNDIAIIYLDSAMTLNDYIQPACLPHVNVDRGEGGGASGGADNAGGVSGGGASDGASSGGSASGGASDGAISGASGVSSGASRVGSEASGVGSGAAGASTGSSGTSDSASSMYEPGALRLISGWGKLREGGAGTRVLQAAYVPLISNADCIRWHQEQDFDYDENDITDNMVCAGFERGGKDACQGDSGGPMVWDEGPVTMVGVISWGVGCGGAKLPGVYTRVANYMGWLNETRRAMGEQYGWE